MKPVDRIGFRDWRRWAAAGAHGRVLEIGAGTGLNYSQYDEKAQVFAFDPDAESLFETDPELVRTLHVDLTSAAAEAIPFPAGTFDYAVGTLVFCTINDPRQGLAEVQRVLKPGATLRLVEHVRSPNPLLGRLMHVATPFWSRLAGGCHLDRDTLAVVRASGLKVTRIHKRFGGMLIGIEARKELSTGRAEHGEKNK